MKWDPEKYVQFGDYRDRPFFDLTGRVLAEAPRHVVDLGCGPGNLTATLADRWPGAQVVGLDSSPEMLVASKDLRPRRPTSPSSRPTSRHWLPSGDTDVVVTNAALQWVPEPPHSCCRRGLTPSSRARGSRSRCRGTSTPPHTP